MSGTFVWYDQFTVDIPAAKAFYTALMGWTLEDFAGGGPAPYTMFKSSATFGGVMSLPDAARAMGAPPHWIGYVSVPDVDAAVAKATALGGRVHVPGTDIPTVGRFAMLTDPTGAAIAVFSSNSPAGEPNRGVAWAELGTTDPAAAWPFYEAMFGWKKADAMEMPGGGTYQMIKGDGDAFAGMSKTQQPMSAWAYYFGCMDARATFAKAKTMGATVLYEPMQVPGGGWAALLVDPQGAAFGLFSMA